MEKGKPMRPEYRVANSFSHSTNAPSGARDNRRVQGRAPKKTASRGHSNRHKKARTSMAGSHQRRNKHWNW